MSTIQPDVEEIERSLGRFCPNGSVVEVRVLHGPRNRTYSGFFNREHLHDAAQQVAGLKAAGVYATLNPVDPALLARAANRIIESPTATADTNIVGRRWLLIDLDPKRPSGISATDDEKTAALAKTEQIREWLAERRWVAPVFADSGNGYHLLYPIDLLNDADAKQLIEHALKALAAQFDDDAVTVDTSVHNAARICKLPGTVARKGDATPDRPHRLSHVLEDPQLRPGEIVTRQQLEKLAALLPDEPKPDHHRKGSVERNDVEAALRFIDPEPRENWLRIGKALKSEFGEGGRSIWDVWSQRSGKFNEPDQDKTWKHIKAEGGIKIGTLFALAKAGGRPGSKKKQGKAKSEWNAAAVADVIQGQLNFAQDEGHKLYVFADGVYRPQGEERVRQCVKKIVPPDDWDTHLANETIEYIRVDSPHLWERPPLDVLNLKNGLLDLRTSRLDPHSPAHLSTIQLPVEYDPAAECPAWDEQVAATFPRDAVLAGVAWQIVGWLMLPLTSIQKALLLLGTGGTGKSTFLSALLAFLGGRRNVSSLSLHKIENDRFAASRLIGKLANICADLPSTHLETSSVFKMITGGDQIPAEYKFKDSFDITPFSRLIFSANQAPQSKDATDAFFDRWFVLPFDHVYRGTEQEISRQELDAKLAAPSELSGVLNRALEVLPAVLDNGLTVTGSMADAREEFQKMTDPLSIWLNQNTIDDPNAFIARTELATVYNAAAAAEGRAGMTAMAFGLTLKKLRPAIKDVQRKLHAKVTWCYLGIGLKASKAEQTSAQSEEPGGQWWNN